MKALTRREIQAGVQATRIHALDGEDISAIFTDTRRALPGGLFVALKGENFDAHDHLEQALSAGACGLVVSKESSLPKTLDPELFVVVVDDTRRALSELGRLVRIKHPGRFAAVTGSVGKTSVKDMLSAALQESGKVAASPGNWNNEIGLPLSLFATHGDEDFVVLELGMSAAGEIQALTEVGQPELGIITAAAAAHLEFFESVDAIADAKAELWEALPDGGRAIACADDARILERAQRLRPEGLISYGLSESADFRVTEVTQSSAGLKATIRHPEGQVTLELKALGQHNAVNAAGALAAAGMLGVGIDEASHSLSTHFRPATHRLQVHQTQMKAFVLDDCYNANPMSTKAALRTLAEVGNSACGLGAVLGSMLELGEDADALHHEVGRFAAEQGVVWLAATGKHAAALAEGARDGGVQSVLQVADADELVEAAQRFTIDGRWLLLKGSRGERLERLLAPLGVEEVR